MFFNSFHVEPGLKYFGDFCLSKSKNVAKWAEQGRKLIKMVIKSETKERKAMC